MYLNMFDWMILREIFVDKVQTREQANKKHMFIVLLLARAAQTQVYAGLTDVSGVRKMLFVSEFSKFMHYTITHNERQVRQIQTAHAFDESAHLFLLGKNGMQEVFVCKPQGNESN